MSNGGRRTGGPVVECERCEGLVAGRLYLVVRDAIARFRRRQTIYNELSPFRIVHHVSSDSPRLVGERISWGDRRFDRFVLDRFGLIKTGSWNLSRLCF